MRKTEAGHLLVEMRKGSENIEKINSALKKAVGELTTVSIIRQTARIGVFGLDDVTTPKEVEQAFRSATGEESDVTVTLERTNRGQQKAIVTASVEAGNKIIDSGYIRVGFVSCRVRIW